MAVYFYNAAYLFEALAYVVIMHFWWVNWQFCSSSQLTNNSRHHFHHHNRITLYYATKHQFATGYRIWTAINYTIIVAYIIVSICVAMFPFPEIMILLVVILICWLAVLVAFGINVRRYMKQYNISGTLPIAKVSAAQLKQQ